MARSSLHAGKPRLVTSLDALVTDRPVTRDQWAVIHHDTDEEPSRRLAATIDALLAKLPDDEREAVELRYIAGLSTHEIAREKGWLFPSGETDRKRASRLSRRGLERLRALLMEGWAFALHHDQIPRE